MHAVVMDSLEEYLAGALEPAAHREIEAHLKTCGMCREEVAGMQQISRLFESLKPEAVTPSAPLGFYARVMQQVAGRRLPGPRFPASSRWTWRSDVVWYSLACSRWRYWAAIW